MRPIELKMQAFGPYRNFVHLDFRKFGNHSIFLVNGPTGAGKTTIFDAISYALFNKVSGTTRDTDMMKSDFASDEELAYVELTFEISNHNYRVLRSPKQKGPGKTKDVINHPSNVEFYREDEYLANGLEANEKITDLLGINHEQFRQIVLLPQGEFQQLLLSNSDKKEEIFRNIFGTQKIEYFQEHLKAKRAEYRKKFEVYETRLEQNLESLEIKSIAMMNKETYKLLTQAMAKKDYQEVLQEIDLIIQKEKENLQEFNGKIEKLNQREKKYQKLTDLLDKKDHFQKKKEELSAQSVDIKESQKRLEVDRNARIIDKENQDLLEVQKEKKLIKEKMNENIRKEEKLIEEIKKLKKEEKISNEKEAELDTLSKKLTSIDFELEKFQEIEKKREKVRELEKKIENILDKIKEDSQKDEKLEKKIDTLIGKINQIETWRKELEEKRKEKEKRAKKIIEKKENKNHLLELLELYEELESLFEKEKELYGIHEGSEKDYRQAREKYFNNIAGILSADLVENEPCPVCGSKEHPAVASDSNNEVSEEKLEDLREKKEQDQLNYKKVELELEKVNEKIKEKKRLVEKDKKHPTKKSYKEKLSLLTNELSEMEEKNKRNEKDIHALVEKLSKESTWRKELVEKQKDFQSTKLSLSESKNNLSHEKVKKKEYAEEIDQVLEELTTKSVEELEQKQEKLKKEIKRIRENAKEIQVALSDKQQEKAGIKSTIKSSKEEKRKTKDKIIAQDKRIEELYKKYELNEGYLSFILEENLIKELKEKIKLYEKEVDYTNRQLKQVIQELEEYKDENLGTAEEIKMQLLDLQKEKEAIKKKRDEFIKKLSSHESSQKEIEKNLKESQEVQRPFEIYSDLAEVASGSTKRTSYVSFERYLLSIYFSEILNAANQRFIKMTNNRYRLIRRAKKTKGQSAEGLEIDVFDRYSGKERSVKTLSGGETFKASLALALGLSDVIQSQKGGVEINTLFIDEGFGSLDADSLEMAIETLMELQSSGRLIGVISHVEELKGRIPAGILVKNIKEGSHAKIVID